MVCYKPNKYLRFFQLLRLSRSMQRDKGIGGPDIVSRFLKGKKKLFVEFYIH